MTDTVTAKPSTTLGLAEDVLDPQKAPAVVTPDDRDRIDRIKASVDLQSVPSVLNFGTASEKEVAQFADTVLEQVMSRDFGPVHEKLSEIKLIAKGLSPENLREKNGFLAKLFFNVKREVAQFSDRFETARGQIDGISAELEDQVQNINLSLIVLDKLFEQNLTNFKDLTLHIAAGHELLDHYRTEVLPAMKAEVQANAEAPDAAIRAQKVHDLSAAVDRLDRKVMNLEKSKAIAFATMPTIRQVQQTGVMLVEELKMALAHAVPAWKSTMIVFIEQLRQKAGIETLEAMTDFTNAQLKAMATQLDQNIEGVHRQADRGIADVDAITETIGSLIATFEKVDRLEAEARESRAQGRARLAEAEKELRDRQVER